MTDETASQEQMSVCADPLARTHHIPRTSYTHTLAGAPRVDVRSTSDAA